MAFSPNFVTSKQVEAYPIAIVGQNYVTVALPDGVTAQQIVVPQAFFARPPSIGDMLVRYADGYLSHCPAAVFHRDARPIGGAPAPVVEEPRVPRRLPGAVGDERLPPGRPHP